MRSHARFMLLVAGFACFAGLAGLSCKHDYDALQHGNGTAIDDSGVGGQSGRDAGDSGEGGTGGSIGACAPCDPPSEAAQELGLEACCRGADRTECGLALGTGTACFSRDAVGAVDSQCPAVGTAGERRDGCCRPDGHCGASFEGIGLGCVAREDIPNAFAPLAEPIACQLECAADSDCTDPSGEEALCVPRRNRPDMRVCAPSCKRDQDCASGLVCALGPDEDFDRLVAFCQMPVGDVEPTEFCSSAEQCVHGVCLRPSGEADALCSQFCRAEGDCPAAFDQCISSTIARPSGEGTPHSFSVCSR